MEPSPKRQRAFPVADAPGNVEEWAQMLADDGGVNKQAIPKLTPSVLHTAASNGQVGLVRTLIAAGADVNAEYDCEIGKHSHRCTKVTPLVLATEYGHDSVVQILIDAGAKVRPARSGYGNKPGAPLLFVGISSSGSAAMVNALVRTGACNINQVYYGMTPLQYAISENALGAVEALLAAGADPNQVGDIDFSGPDSREYIYGVGISDTLYGASLLHEAAYLSFDAAIGPLVAAGARVDERCGKGFTPLGIAAMVNSECEQHLEAIQRTIKDLVKAGADINARRHDVTPAERQTPLYYALYVGEASVAKALILMGADVKKAWSSTESLLRLLYGPRDHYCGASLGVKIKALLEAGIKLTGAEMTFNKRPLLSDCAWRRNAVAMKALLDAGADPTIRDEEGETALSLLLRPAHYGGGYSLHRWEPKPETVVALIKAGDLSSWDAIPAGFQGLECLVGYLHEHAPQHLGSLFKKLPLPSQEAIREAMRVMYRLLPGGGGVEQVRFDIVAQAFS